MGRNLASLLALLVVMGTASSSPSKPTGVGMVALVANPQRYDGKLIRTVGFLCIGFEGDAVYVHDEDFRHGLTKNSMALRLSSEQRKRFKNLSQGYVVIEGKVFASGLESTDMWAGALGDITRLEVWPVDRGTAKPNN